MAEVKLFVVQFKLDNPFGTYLDGDGVVVYYNDSTDQFVVYYNDVVVTSGDPIGVQTNNFKLDGKTWSDYYSGRFFNAQICSGSTLLTFERIYVFPYVAVKLRLNNHPACDIFALNLVCDIEFDSGLPVVTNCSTDTTADGTITVTASSTNSPIKYRLNDDFEYDGPDGQTSGAFTALLPGDYVVYARDSINCLRIISVTVGVTYTYSSVYRLEFYAHNGYHFKADVLEKDYAGSVIEVRGGSSSPLIMRKRAEGEKDKFVSVIASEAELNMMSSVNSFFTSLMTNDPEKFRVKIYMDSGSGYSALWTGKMLTNQYQEPYTAPPYPISIIATCGISELKDYPFLDAQGNRYNGAFKQIEVIAFILKKTGLLLNIRSYLNIYATTMASTAADDPLAQAYVDMDTYYVESDVPNCLDVLKYIIEPYGAHIVQWENCFCIVRMEEMIQGTMAYREFTSEGVYSSNGTTNSQKQIKRSIFTDCLSWMETEGSVNELQPGFGAIQLQYIMGKKANIFKNGDFAQKKISVYYNNIDNPGAGVDPVLKTQVMPDTTGFEIVANGTTLMKSVETIDGDNVGLVVDITEKGGYLLTESINTKMGFADQLRFTWTVKVDPNIYNDSISYIKVKIQVKYGTWYMLSDGTWTQTESAIAFYTQKNEWGKFNTYSITADKPLDATTTDGLNLFSVLYFPHPYDPEFTSLTNMKAKATINTGEGFRTEIAINNSLCYYELKRTTNPIDTATIPSIVRPNDYNSSTNPYQWVLQKTILSPITGRSCKITIDKVVLEFLNNGKLLPEQQSFKKLCENNNKTVLNRTIRHGSLIKDGSMIFAKGRIFKDTLKFIGGQLVNQGVIEDENYFAGYQQYSIGSADIVYAGYLRSASGVGFTTWGRDLLNGEAKNIEQIYLDMYEVQYKRAWQKITGNLITKDTFLGFLDSAIDGTIELFPVSLELDVKRSEYSGEFMEVFDPVDGVGFSTGFSIGFDA